jgi:hypothetical protein
MTGERLLLIAPEKIRKNRTDLMSNVFFYIYQLILPVDRGD